MVKRVEKAPTHGAIAESILLNTASRNDDLIALVKILDSIEGPYSVLLDAPWGDGKTFFVKSLEEVLKDINPNIATNATMSDSLKKVTSSLQSVETPFLPFYFNAWKYDFAEDPISALFANMAIEFNKISFRKSYSARSCIASVIDASLAVASTRLKVADMTKTFSGESLIEAYEKHTLLRERINALAEESILEVANKLVIIIDELDRCRPDFSIRLLEQTKSLFQNENIIIIISTDSLQLAHATAGSYGPKFDSQHFIERFFDQRLTLMPSNAYKVATGETIHDSFHNYDLLKNELIESRKLTIRDCARIYEKLAAGRAYCDMHDDGSLVAAIIKCLFIPLLIFIEREDTELFRAITRGTNFDALYEYGSHYSTFTNFLNKNLHFIKTGQRQNETAEVTEEERKDYIRDICIWLFSSNRNGRECNDAYSRIGMPRGIDPGILATLRFPLRS